MASSGEAHSSRKRRRPPQVDTKQETETVDEDGEEEAAEDADSSAKEGDNSEDTSSRSI